MAGANRPLSVVADEPYIAVAPCGGTTATPSTRARSIPSEPIHAILLTGRIWRCAGLCNLWLADVSERFLLPLCDLREHDRVSLRTDVTSGTGHFQRRPHAEGVDLT